jgi:hypothetical protein
MWSNEHMHWEQARRLLVSIILKQEGCYKRELWDGVRVYFTKLESDTETNLR